MGLRFENVQGLTIDSYNFGFEIKVILGLESTMAMALIELLELLQ